MSRPKIYHERQFSIHLFLSLVNLLNRGKISAQVCFCLAIACTDVCACGGGAVCACASVYARACLGAGVFDLERAEMAQRLRKSAELLKNLFFLILIFLGMMSHTKKKMKAHRVAERVPASAGTSLIFSQVHTFLFRCIRSRRAHILWY